MAGKKWSMETRIKTLESRKKSQKRGMDHHLWKGGKQVNSDGYVLIRVSNNKHTRYAMEHRIVMEKFIGRKLRRNEQVHHRNGIKDDNRIENLEIVSSTYHFGIIICPHCQKEFKIK